MRRPEPDCVNPDLCEWEFVGGDHSVGIEDAWICATCGAVDMSDTPPPDDPDLP